MMTSNNSNNNNKDAGLISWNKPKSKYRSSTQTIQTTHDAHFFENVSLNFSPPSMISKGKARPLVEIYDLDELKQHEQDEQDKQADTANVYDNFQPMFAHFSETQSPAEMKTSVEKVLQLLVDDGELDFYNESPFVYAGRVYSSDADCEFRISIFSGKDDDHQSVVEIVRSSGDANTFAKTEKTILFQLDEYGAVQLGLHWSAFTAQDSDDFCLPDELPHYDLGLGLGHEHSESGLDLSFSDTESSDLVLHGHFPADVCLERAIDGTAFQTEIRARVLNLKNGIDKHPMVYKHVNDIVAKLIAFISDTYDAFVIRTILQCVFGLIKVNAPVPDSFVGNIQHVRERWQDVVVNAISPDLMFRFAPSQQIAKECDCILNSFAQSKAK